ncbi:MAG: TIGR02281 family clan AA aspartic protease [Rhizobiaceae bacterium]
MLRNVILLGICIGSATSVPILYQANPESFHRLYGTVTGSAPPADGRIETVQRIGRGGGPASNPSARKVSLEADGRGHFLGEFRINGRAVTAMVDTGATVVAMNLSTARRAGISVGPKDFRHKVTTANGEVRAAAATIATMQIGRIAIDNVEALVLEDKALSGTLVGVSFLNRLSRYQVENGTLMLAQ